MSPNAEFIEAPLTREQLVARWQALCNDPTFDDAAGKVELTEWGEILLMPPVGLPHGLLATRAARALEDALGGRTFVEVGIVTALGVRAPDVAWCSDGFLAAHPEGAPLSSAPEICVEIVSPSDALPKLREKAAAYCGAGAVEAWLLVPGARGRFELYGPGGRLERTSFRIDVGSLLID